MKLQSLYIVNFRNIKTADINIHERILTISGSNGSGKTNLLDAISCLSIVKSSFSSGEDSIITLNEPFCTLKGNFLKKGVSEEVFFAFERGGKKVIKRNGTVYERQKDHIGKYPVVLSSPNDTSLIKEGSESRRRFFDSIFSQVDKIYLEELILYNHYLRQRNAYLKTLNHPFRADDALLDAYDERLLQHGKKIIELRTNYLDDFIPLARLIFSQITDENEALKIIYESQWKNQAPEKALSTSRKSDIRSQRSNSGIHKDDYVFEFNDLNVKSFASQGQQKSFAIALRLAQRQFIYSKLGERPILLLDDLFDRLDYGRIKRIVQNLGQEENQQLVITHTSKKQLDELLMAIGFSFQNLEIEHGIIKS